MIYRLWGRLRIRNISYLISYISYLSTRGGYKKFPSPERVRGGIQLYNVFHGSTLVASGRMPLIDALTGVPGGAFPRPRLRSGIILGSVLGSSHQKIDPSLKIFPKMRVFIAAFYHSENLSQIRRIVKTYCVIHLKNPKKREKQVIIMQLRKNKFLCQLKFVKPQRIVVKLHNYAHILDECLHKMININSAKVDGSYPLKENA